jgi:hypothetical protein
MVRCDQARHEPTHAGQDIDRRIVPTIGEAACEHDVTVQDASYRIADRLVEVVTLDQHGIERRDAALLGIARPL